MFWVSEQRLVSQTNTLCRNSWITELETEELERKVTGSTSVIVKEARSVGALPDRSCRRRREKCFAGHGSRRAG